MPATTPCRPWSAIWSGIPRFRSKASSLWNESAALKNQVWEQQEFGSSVMIHSSMLQNRCSAALPNQASLQILECQPNPGSLGRPNDVMVHSPEVFQHDLS